MFRGKPIRDPGATTQVIDEESTAPLPPAPQPPPQAPFEEPPPSRDVWPWLLVLLVLVVAGLFGAWLATRDNHRSTGGTTPPPNARPVPVPDVTGQQVAAAIETLKAQGLTTRIVQVPSDQPSGQVVAQHPRAGATAPARSAVRLNVSSGRPQSGATTTQTPQTRATVTVPDVGGARLPDARKTLRRAGLVAEVRHVPSSLPKNTVVAQAVAPGTSATRGDHVLLTVSDGSKKQAKAPSSSAAARAQVPIGRFSG